MPRNASGTYQLPPSNPVVTGTTISTGWANPTLTDIANALTESISKTGVTTPSADLPMGGFKHLNVAAATGPDQYARMDQVQSGALNVLTAVAMPVANTYTATLVGAPAAFFYGQMLVLSVPNPNTGGVTLDINGTGPRAIVKWDGGPLTVGMLQAGRPFTVIYDGTAWRADVGRAGFTYFPADAAGQTFTNKCYAPGWGQLYQTLTVGGPIVLDFATAQSQIINANANITVTGVTLFVGNMMRIVFKLGAFSLSFAGSGVLWPGGAEPVWTSGANKIAVVVFTNVNTEILGAASIY